MKPELLAPAGNLEKVRWASAYGADAVYFGCEFGSLRSFAGNLSFDDAQKALDLLHKIGKKGYITLNIYPHSDEYGKLIKTARALQEMGADAFIVADLGVLSELKNKGIRTDLHISTQANTCSSQSALAYHNFGAKRVNLARELSLEQIQQIQKDIQGKMETEIFIHGSVCFSYSGRCAISDYLTGFRANHGECKHPCRWKYALVEEKRPDEYLPVFEDNRGLYLFNSKELALFPYIPALTEAGVCSFKIEGRMKSIHYIASAVSFYRQVIDGKKFTEDQAMELLNRIPNRGYSRGFMKGSITPEDYSVGQSLSQANSIFVGNVLAEKINGKSVIEVRNRIHAEDLLEALKPDGTVSTLTMPDPLIDKFNKAHSRVNNSQFIMIDSDLPEYTILRRVNKNNLRF